jgi:hypothetical protein
MDATTRAVGRDPGDSIRRCRVIWDADGREASVWVANGDEVGWVSRQRVDVIRAVADRAVEQVRDEARGADMALDAIEVLRDPRMIVPLTIAAVAQVAAVHAGIPTPVAKLIGDAAGKLSQRLLTAESGRDADPAVRYGDFDYDIATGRTWPDDPEIKRADRASRHDAIDGLLDPRRDAATRAARGTPAARNLSRGTVQDVQPVRAARAGTGVARSVPPARSQPTDRGNKLRGVTPDRKGRSRGGRDGVDGR